MDALRVDAVRRLLVALASDGGRGADVAAEAVPWSRLPHAVVRRHLLAPLAHTIGGTAFRRDYLAAQLFAEIRLDVLASTVAILRTEGIPVLLLKGCSYLGAIYADPATRPMTDLDLMVPAAQHAAAAAILGARGYQHAGPARQISPLDFALTLKRRGVAVDLHRSIVQPLRSRLDVAALWARAQPVAALPGAHRLAAVDELLIHLMHMARHELIVAAVSYIDAVRLDARLTDDDRAVLRARARDYRIGRAIAAAIAAVALMTNASALSLDRAPGDRRHAVPTSTQIAAGRVSWRPLQIARKLALVEGPAETAGLLVVGLTGVAFQLGGWAWNPAFPWQRAQ